MASAGVARRGPISGPAGANEDPAFMLMHRQPMILKTDPGGRPIRWVDVRAADAQVISSRSM
jgi:hypothetical protein